MAIRWVTRMEDTREPDQRLRRRGIYAGAEHDGKPKVGRSED